jgi:3-keto-disaccharide hydrolase
VDNFELHFQFRLVRGNSGVYYRAQQLDKLDAGGYEFEIYTNRIGNLADNGPDREKRRLFYQDFDKAPKTDAEWHEGTVIANGGRLIHRLDGQELCQVEDTNGRAPRSGLLAFHLGSATVVEFRDIRLKRISGN